MKYSDLHDDPLKTIGDGYPECIIYNVADTVSAYENDGGVPVTTFRSIAKSETRTAE